MRRCGAAAAAVPSPAERLPVVLSAGEAPARLRPSLPPSNPSPLCHHTPCPWPGVRIISADRHALLRRVPPAAASVLEIGSTSPGALLYDARRLFDAQDARATGAPADGGPAETLGAGAAGRAACLLPLLSPPPPLMSSAPPSPPPLPRPAR